MFTSRSQFDLFLKPGILGGPAICSYGKVRVAHTLKDPAWGTLSGQHEGITYNSIFLLFSWDHGINK